MPIPAPAELAVLGAAVWTLDPVRPLADAVVIGGGRILFVGSEREARELIGPRTRTLALGGGMVLPGFQDAHVHPDHGGLDRMRCDLHDAGGVEEYVARIRAYASANPGTPWILGGGWAMDSFERGTPHHSVLDGAVPDRPAFLKNRDGHGAWVNARALEVAGITRSTPDPTDGRIERDDAGEPFGTLHEGAMALVERLVPPPSAADLEAALLAAQAYLHSLGVTAWQDAHVGPETLEAYLRLDGDGRLTARVVGALWWDRSRGEEQIAELRTFRDRATSHARRFRATAVKIMQDGVVENFTAAMLDPYLDRAGRATSNRGLSFVEPGLLMRAVAGLDRDGFQVHVHAIGDRAVREALDAFERARASNGPRDARHHIAHIQVVHPEDVPRFAELGVVANAQPYWACSDGQMRNLTIPFLGPERTSWQYPFAGLLAAGATLAFGSDWPVSTPDPLKEIQVAVTRAEPAHLEAAGGPETEAFLPGQRVDLAAALRAFTLGSAFVNHLDADTGSVAPGKLADLVVLDRNLFDAAPGEIGRARVLLTLVEGSPVHAAPGWDR